MHIGIITCEILRNEIREVIREIGVEEVFLLLPDNANSVTIVPYQQVVDRFSSGFAKDGLVLKKNWLAKIADEIRERGLKDSVILNVLELQMHTYPDLLLAEIKASIKRMSSVADVIVLGFGLCGSSSNAMEHVINEASVPVLIPRDKKGEILNNCIEIALGKEKVASLQKEERGTFFMTPMGALLIKEPQVILESYNSITAGRTSRFAATDAPRIIKILKNHYNRVVKIWHSTADLKDEDYTQTVKKFARKFNLEIKQVRGSAEIMRETVEKGGIVAREF